MKKFSKRLSALFLVLLTLLSLIGPTYAVSDSSAKQTKTVYGYTYKFYSTISTAYELEGKLSAGTHLESTYTPYLPEGYMGTQPRLYNSNGVLFASGTWRYTTYNTSVAGYATSFNVEKDTYYYSQGMVALYNGDGYTRYSCTKTPNYMIQSRSRSTEDIVVETNANGEIFGAAPILEQINITPDLILAIGTNGKTGYVKSSDLNMDYISNPDFATSYTNYIEAKMNSCDQSSALIIPLYESDGVTVIGEFALSFPDNIIEEA